MASYLVYGEIYPVIQINGQRIAGPCENWKKFNRSANEFKEIFIARIPRDISEADLLPIFASIGPIWKFRLMMNFSGQNRGFAYIQYIHEENHEKAIQMFHDMEIIPGLKMFLTMSRNLNTLSIGGFKWGIDLKDISDEIRGTVPVQEIRRIFKKPGEMALLLSFSTHREAALSRRTLLSLMPTIGPHAWIRWESAE